MSNNSQLMTEWNWQKNSTYNPYSLTSGSGKKVWWRCSKGHEWQAVIAHRTKGMGCPYCSGRYAIKGLNDLQTVNPSLASEWNYALNNKLLPLHMLPNSNKKVWWICSKGHEWQATVFSRNKGSNCPFCSGNIAIKGTNDLQTVNPTLAAEWSYASNGKLTPTDVLPQSDKKVWWICKEGHEWQAKICNRTNGRGCPYCSGKKLQNGINDLQTVNPLLSAEWHYELNINLTPADVLPNSNKKVWWRCSKGHEWQAVISSRTRGNGCPICSSGLRTSFPEYAIVYYFQKYGIDVIQSYKDLGYELDIFIPSQRTAIEYDGYLWHKEKSNKDLAKNQKCLRDKIKLYRIREGLPPLNDSSIDFLVHKNHSNLSETIQNVLRDIIKIDVDVNVQRDFISIESMRKHIEYTQSLLSSNPSLAEEWNHSLNGKLLPTHVLPNSTKKVWWICKEGHEWQATIQTRNTGSGCPYCSGKAVKLGFNDLQTINPTLAKEWNNEKNLNLKPIDVTTNSGKKVWWKCKNGHEWQATICHRSNGTGCPYCSSKIATKGTNDLQTVAPTLASEWNFNLNENLLPTHVLPNSNKKVWWKCKDGHEWQATVNNRSKGSGCPYCSGRLIKTGYNDLQTVNPTLAKEWNHTKNLGLRPNEISPSNSKKVWWICAIGHEWQSTINNRSKGKGCPQCAGEKRKKRN